MDPRGHIRPSCESASTRARDTRGTESYRGLCLINAVVSISDDPAYQEPAPRNFLV